MKTIKAVGLIVIFLLLTACGNLQQAVVGDTMVQEGEIYDSVEIADDGHIEYDESDYRVDVNYPVSITDFDNHEATLKNPSTPLLCSNYDILSTVLATTGNSYAVAGFNKEDMVGTLIYRLFPELRNQDSLIQDGQLNDILCQQTEGALLLIPYGNKEFAESEAAGFVQPFVIPGDGVATAGNVRTYTMLAENAFDRQYILDVILTPEVESIEKSIRTLDFDQRKSVLFLGNTMDSLYTADTADWIIRSAGGYSAATDVELTKGYLDYFGDICCRYESIRAEQIATWNPDVIWVPWFAEYTVEDVLCNPEFQNLKAVQNGDVYAFPSELEPWYYPTTASYLGVFWAANNLYPDLYSRERLEEMIVCYYKETYDANLTAADAGLLPNA